MKPSITIAVSCHMFQRRLSWMLSSLHQQNNKKSYDLIFDIAYEKNEVSDPPMEKLIDTFTKLGINIKARPYDGFERMQFRGFVRNDVLKDCKTDFLLFADTDMVYHPDFFSELFKLLKTDEWKDCPNVMACGRYSNDIALANKLIDKENYILPLIATAWDKADNNLNKLRRLNVGAGFWQLINMKTCPHENYYVGEKRNRDWGWFDGKRNMQKASSDYQFRRRVKRLRMPEWFSKNQIHLNHFRDNQHGTHLTGQR